MRPFVNGTISVEVKDMGELAAGEDREYVLPPNGGDPLVFAIVALPA